MEGLLPPLPEQFFFNAEQIATSRTEEGMEKV